MRLSSNRRVASPREERAIQDAHATHIDLEAFRSFLDRLGFDTKMDPQPNRDDDLRNRGILTLVGGELRGTLYGVLAFGRDPQRYAPTRNFRIECSCPLVRVGEVARKVVFAALNQP